ncbi:MAG TPA: hypothetical protein VJK50_04795 [Patescibacteria group bacterium]|nr:hypothetical protein [Patescibacteria group bacterium]
MAAALEKGSCESVLPVQLRIQEGLEDARARLPIRNVLAPRLAAKLARRICTAAELAEPPVIILALEQPIPPGRNPSTALKHHAHVRHLVWPDPALLLRLGRIVALLSTHPERIGLPNEKGMSSLHIHRLLRARQGDCPDRRCVSQQRQGKMGACLGFGFRYERGWQGSFDLQVLVNLRCWPQWRAQRLVLFSPRRKNYWRQLIPVLVYHDSSFFL